ncbi:hypothetical protein YC2023_060284 [Brassica napus]
MKSSTMNAVFEQDGDRRSIGMFPTVCEKATASSHHSFSDKIANTAPPVQAFSQNIENHSVVPYQNTPLDVGESQVLPPTTAATHPLGCLNPENRNVVSREELNHISNILVSLAQLFGNGQPNPNIHSTLNPIQSMQLPQVYGQKEQSSHTQTHILGIHIGVIPYSQQRQFGLVSWKTWTKGDKKKLPKRRWEKD